MNDLLLKLFIMITIMQTGIALKDFTDFSTKQNQLKLKTAQVKILNIDWKPISVFPEEARKFRAK